MNKLYFGHRLSCCVAWRLPMAITAICLRHLRDSGCKITTIWLEAQGFRLIFSKYPQISGILADNIIHFVTFAVQTNAWNSLAYFLQNTFCKYYNQTFSEALCLKVGDRKTRQKHGKSQHFQHFGKDNPSTDMQ